MKICTRCVLPDTFPGIRFNDEGVCIFCQRYKGEADLAAKQEVVRKKFEEVVERIRPQQGYHCLLAFSGGKDSSYTLWLLRERYDLRVLAVTLDNGFISPQAFVNMNRMVEELNADFLIIKPRLDLLKNLFTSVSKDSPYPAKAIERASSTCNACIALVKNATLRVAIEQQIPLIAYGWSPGQAPVSASMFKMNSSMLKQMHETRSAPLRNIAGETVAPFLLEEKHLATEDLPYNVNPLAFNEYDEGELVKLLEGMGWEAPKDTDGNSSNCLLNTFANRLHIDKHGFHPYAFEVAGLIRAGMMTRDEGLADLADLGTDEVLETVTERLGLESES